MPAASLLDALTEALLAEERARGEVRTALAHQAELLRHLRALGLPATRVAHRVAASQGVALPIGDRQRFARRLRKRAERETARRAGMAGFHGLTASPTSSWSWAISPPQQEEVMPKLVKRTITEEYVEEKDQDLDEVEDGAEEEDGDEPDEEEKPAKARRR